MLSAKHLNTWIKNITPVNEWNVEYWAWHAVPNVESYRSRMTQKLEQAIKKILKNKEHRGIDWVYMKLRNDVYAWNGKKVLRV